MATSQALASANVSGTGLGDLEVSMTVNARPRVLEQVE